MTTNGTNCFLLFLHPDLLMMLCPFVDDWLWLWLVLVRMLSRRLLNRRMLLWCKLIGGLVWVSTLWLLIDLDDSHNLAMVRDCHIPFFFRECLINQVVIEMLQELNISNMIWVAFHKFFLIQGCDLTLHSVHCGCGCM